MRLRWLSITDPLWHTIIEPVQHDVYHLPEYLQVSARYEAVADSHPTAFLAEEGSSFCLIPLLISPLPECLGAPPEWRDGTSPYGYAAPLFCGDAAWIEKVLRLFSAECCARSIVSVFLRMHPLLPLPPGLEKHGTLMNHGETVYIDLTLDEAELWGQIRGRMRSYINRLQRCGYSVSYDDWNTYDEFIEVYTQTMERLQARSFYRFPMQYFKDMREALGHRLHLCSVHEPGGQFACGALLTEINGIVQYHLSGTAESVVADAPSKLMLHAITVWARRRGCRVLHLGGGVGGRSDSLLQFKSGFSPLRSSFYTFRLISDESKYAFLCSRTEAVHSAGAYFPSYRCSA